MVEVDGEPRPVRVLVVDDHEMVRAGLAVLLVAPYEVVASVASTTEAVRAAGVHQPDIVLLDVRFGDGNGVDAVKEIRAAAPATQVVMLSTYEDAAWARAALDAGARGYLVKDADQLDLVRSLDRVRTGGVALDARIAAAVLAPQAHGLTERELDIIDLVARGLSNRDIAAELHLSAHTVKEYVSSLLRKLGAPTRAAAVSNALALGLLRDGPRR